MTVGTEHVTLGNLLLNQLPFLQNIRANLEALLIWISVVELKRSRVSIEPTLNTAPFELDCVYFLPMLALPLCLVVSKATRSGAELLRAITVRCEL